MKLNPYLFFQGQCKAAIEFYVKVLNAKVLMMMDHSQAPPEHLAPGVSKDWIMHARIEFKGQILMASDGPSEPMSGSSLSLMVDTPEEADQLFAALSEGGSIQMPIEKTFWAVRFGMLTDKFGIPWMINCEQAG
jgi:PhnB protein